MREILFRGKRLTDGEWIYGDYYKKYLYFDKNGRLVHYILNQTVEDEIVYNEYDEVDPKTIGEYAEVENGNGEKIFEGDILHKDCCWELVIEYKGSVPMVRDMEKVRYNNKITNCPVNNFNFNEWKVIGNIHDKEGE